MITSAAADFTHIHSLCSQEEGERFMATLCSLQGHGSLDVVGNWKYGAAAASFLLGAEEGCPLGKGKVTGRRN